MRDSTKILVMRQEHNAQSSTKSRNKLALDFRHQVEDHKVELERLERKLLTTSSLIKFFSIFWCIKELLLLLAKTIMQQGSMESLSGDQLTEKASPISAKGPIDVVNQLESHLKVLMQITGATSSADVLNRFTSQKEASTRLNYLRAITEGEKRHLESERDSLTAQLESLKFSDNKENEVLVGAWWLLYV